MRKSSHAAGRARTPRGDLLGIIHRPITDLKPDPANPRVHSKQQVRQIAKSIKTFGFNVPILVDAELKVIAGHGRSAGLPRAWLAEVPTLCLDHLTPAQARAFMIADNRLTEIAAWDDRLLASSSRTSPCSASTSASRSPASRWPRSICGSRRSMTAPEATTTRPMRSPEPAACAAGQQDRRSVAARPPSRAVRQCARCRGLRTP